MKQTKKILPETFPQSKLLHLILVSGNFTPRKRYPLHPSIQIQGIFIRHSRDKIHQRPE